MHFQLIETMKILELPRSCSLKFCFVPETKRKSVKPFLKVWDFYNLLWTSSFLFLLLWTLCSVMRRPSNDAVAVWTAVSHVLLNRQRSVVIGIMIMIILSMVNGDQNYDHGHDWWGSWWYLGTSLKSTIFFSWPYWDIKISKWAHKIFPKIIWKIFWYDLRLCPNWFHRRLTWLESLCIHLRIVNETRVKNHV